MVQLKKYTDKQVAKWAKEEAVYNDYNSLIQREGQSRTEVVKYLKSKYGINATSTIYQMLKRAELRLNS